MPLKPPPSFVGNISIASTNNKIYWEEQTPSATFSATLSNGSFDPSSLATALQTALNGAGAAHTYTVTFSLLTGRFTISATGAFKVLCKTTDTNKAWSGGDSDSYGATITQGEVFKQHLGFPVDDAGSVYSFGTSVDSPQSVFAFWRPTFPPSDDDEINFKSVASEVISLSGAQTVYDYTGSNVDADFFPNSKQPMEYRNLSFDLITQYSREQFLYHFWLPYAKQGGSFRYYEDPVTPSAYRVYTLTGESLEQSTFTERRKNMPRWSGKLNMFRQDDQDSVSPTSIVDGLDTEDVDMSYTTSQYHRTMTENTTLAIISAITQHASTLYVDSLSTSYALTLPSGVTVLSGSYDFTKGRVNKIEITCTNASKQEYTAQITPLPCDTDVEEWPMEETGEFDITQSTDHVSTVTDSGTVPDGMSTIEDDTLAPNCQGTYLIGAGQIDLPNTSFTASQGYSWHFAWEQANSSEVLVHFASNSTSPLDEIQFYHDPSPASFGSVPTWFFRYRQGAGAAKYAYAQGANYPALNQVNYGVMTLSGAGEMKLYINKTLVMTTASGYAVSSATRDDRRFGYSGSSSTTFRRHFLERYKGVLDQDDVNDLFDNNWNLIDLFPSASAGDIESWYLLDPRRYLKSQEFDHSAVLQSGITQGGIDRVSAPVGMQKIAGTTCYDFDGTNVAYVDLPNKNLPDEFSYFFVIRPDVLNKYIFNAHDASGAYTDDFIRFLIDASGYLVLEAGATTGTAVSITSDTALSAANEYVVGFSIKRSTQEGNIFISGALDKSGSLGAMATMDRIIRLGGHGASSTCFDGIIGRVGYLARLASAEEASLIYNSDRGNSLAVSTTR